MDIQVYNYLRNYIYPILEQILGKQEQLLTSVDSIVQRVGQLVFIVGFFATLYFVCRFLGDLLFSY